MKVRATAALGASIFALALGGVSEAQALGTGVPGVDPAQAINQNSTDQNAGAQARSNQVNVNAPITVLSNKSGNGDVYQRNTADNDAHAKNYNDTDQSSRQSSTGDGSGWDSEGARHGSGENRSAAGLGGRIHKAVNHNRTRQSAKAKARSRQVNVNAPLTALSKHSGNGDVEQSNEAVNFAKARNANDTDQSGRLQDGGSGCCSPTWQDLPNRDIAPLSSIGHQVGNTLQPGLAGGLLLMLAGLAFAAGRARRSTSR